MDKKDPDEENVEEKSETVHLKDQQETKDHWQEKFEAVQ